MRGLVQRPEPRTIHFSRGQTDRGDLQHQPKLEDLLDVAQGDGGHRVPLPPARDDQPFLAQAHHRAADRRLAHSVTRGEHPLGDVLSGLQGAGDDVVLDRPVGDVVQVPVGGLPGRGLARFSGCRRE